MPDAPLRQFVHIPKTGGSALRQALGVRNLDVRFPGHRYPVSAFPKADQVFTVVRDPVDRFVSAFWHAQPIGWETPESLAHVLPDSVMQMLVFRPQVAWVDTDRELFWVGHTETLDEDYRRLKEMLGPARHGALIPKPKHNYPDPRLSRRAIDNIRAYYADDYDLLARLP